MPSSRKIHLSIPKPCQENWGEMTPTEIGRYCQSCQKEVVDFSGMSDDKIIDFFYNSRGQTCGRFHRNQLNKELIETKSVSRPSTLKLVFASFIALLGFKETSAQEVIEHADTVVMQPTTTEPSITDNEERKAPIVIRGTLIDAKSREPLIGGNVVLEDYPGYGCVTDLDGHFELTVPDDFQAESISLRFNYIGYVSKHIQLCNTSSSVIVELHYDMTKCFVVGGAVEIEPRHKRFEEMAVKHWLRSIGHW